MTTKADTNGAQVNATELQLQTGHFQPTDQLQGLLGALSSQQASAVIRIAEAEIAGVSIESLLEGDNKICSRSTYYHRSRGGWVHKPEFQEALGLARREIRAHRATSVVDEALMELRESTPLAARELRRQIAGDEIGVDILGGVLLDAKAQDWERISAAVALGKIGTRRSTDVLIDALQKVGAEIAFRVRADTEGTEDTSEGKAFRYGDALYFSLRHAVIDALGQSSYGVSAQRRLAARDVLNRASKDTADKSAGVGTGVMVYIPDNERDDDEDTETPGGAANAVPAKQG